jgi:hypothetical protein
MRMYRPSHYQSQGREHQGSRTMVTVVELVGRATQRAVVVRLRKNYWHGHLDSDPSLSLA